MASLIFYNNQLTRIAANDTDQGDLNLPNPLGSGYTVKTITDSDFNSVRQNLKNVSFDGTTVSYTDETWEFPDSGRLSNYLKDFVIDRCNDFLMVNNTTHAFYNRVETYRNYVRDFDVSTITYPYTKSWEKYCTDNSITYLHPLQIP